LTVGRHRCILTSVSGRVRDASDASAREAAFRVAPPVATEFRHSRRGDIVRTWFLILGLLAALAWAQDSLPWQGAIVFDARVRVDDAPGLTGHPAYHSLSEN